MPRHSSPRIHRLVLYGVEYILDADGNRTDENRPSKKDPRKRKIKNKTPKKFIKRKKKIDEHNDIKISNLFNNSSSPINDGNLILQENNNDVEGLFQKFIDKEYENDDFNVYEIFNDIDYKF